MSSAPVWNPTHTHTQSLSRTNGMCVNSVLLQLLLLLVSLGSSGWLGVYAIRVYTSGHVEAVNGTDVRLKCSFSSSAPVRRSALTISWSFRPLGPGHEETVFYYHEKPFPPTEGRFLKKVIWAGDISSRDASIVLKNVKFTYNGTFSCQVKNPPDVHGNVGEVRLRVVTSASFSEIVILAVAIGGAVLLIIIIFIGIVSVRRCREKDRLEREGVVHMRQKDPVLW